MKGGRWVATALGLLALVVSVAVLRIGAVEPTEPARSPDAFVSGRLADAVTETWVCPVGRFDDQTRHEIVLSNGGADPVVATVRGLGSETLVASPETVPPTTSTTAPPADATSSSTEAPTTTEVPTSTTMTPSTMAAAAPVSMEIAALSTTVVDAEELGIAGSVVVKSPGGSLAVEHRIVTEAGSDQAPCSTSQLSRWYVADATTRRATSLVLWLANAGASDAAVALAFVTSDGVRNPAAFSAIQVPAGEAVAVDIGAVVQRQDAVAFSIVADHGLVTAEALQVDDGSGELPSAVHLVVPSPATSTRWTIPYGSTAEGVAEDVTVFNPSDTRVDREFSVHGSGVGADLASEPFSVSVAPFSTAQLALGGESRVAPGLAHRIDVRSPNVGVVVAQSERVSAEKTEDDGDRPAAATGWYGTSGSLVASTEWIVPAVSSAEGDGADTWIGVANSGSEDVAVQLILYGEGAESAAIAEPLFIAPGDMRAVPLDVPLDGVYSVRVLADGPVVVGRRVGRLDPADVVGALGIPNLGAQASALRVDG